ncbi:hypothetical protein C2W62_16480 [Candidatus Entotheonella serta]|nr:hypothetical protein C2W62_16480 [Candidatus Entotheonella serta]
MGPLRGASERDCTRHFPVVGWDNRSSSFWPRSSDHFDHFGKHQSRIYMPQGPEFIRCDYPNPLPIFPDPVTSGEERVRQTAERTATLVPLERPGQLREVGYLALYLASAASDYMTGQTLFLDGGMSL